VVGLWPSTHDGSPLSNSEDRLKERPALTWRPGGLPGQWHPTRQQGPVLGASDLGSGRSVLDLATSSSFDRELVRVFGALPVPDSVATTFMFRLDCANPNLSHICYLTLANHYNPA
jgi:hypothetical protein